MSENPLTQMARALWDTLEDSSHFTKLVLPGNRIKYYERTPRERDVLSGPADVPEVAVMLVETRPNATGDSSGMGWDFTWAIRVATGERQSDSLFDVQWAVIRALSHWEVRMKHLTWETYDYVKSCRALKTVCDLDNREVNRGTRGWSDIWTGEIKCWFQRFDLQT